MRSGGFKVHNIAANTRDPNQHRKKPVSVIGYSPPSHQTSHKPPKKLATPTAGTTMTNPDRIDESETFNPDEWKLNHGESKGGDSTQTSEKFSICFEPL